jgi:hypothetical protein
MPDWFISFIFGAGAGGFVYSKVMKMTMRSDAAATLAVVSGIVGFIVIFSLAKLLHV